MILNLLRIFIYNHVKETYDYDAVEEMVHNSRDIIQDVLHQDRENIGLVRRQ
jgi:hypothetical protein